MQDHNHIRTELKPTQNNSNNTHDTPNSPLPTQSVRLIHVILLPLRGFRACLGLPGTKQEGSKS